MCSENMITLCMLEVKAVNSHIAILLVCVDDIVLTVDDLEDIQALKILVDQKFKIKDLLDHLIFF